MFKDIIKTWLISFILLALGINYYMVLTNNVAVEIPSNIVVSFLIALIPSIVFAISIYFSEKFMKEKQTKKAVWTIPIILLISLFIILIGFTIYNASTCYAEGCMGIFFLIVFGPISVIAFSIVFSLLPSIYIRYTTKKFKNYPLYIALGLIILFALLIIITYFTCNFGYDPNCLSYKAYNNQNPDICEKAASILIKDRCYSSLAQQTLNVDLCNKVSQPQFCFEDIENRIRFSQEREEIRVKPIK